MIKGLVLVPWSQPLVLREVMPKVQTAKGLIDRDLLTVEDIVTEDETARVIATEWRLADGELVKRDVHAIILSGLALAGEQAEIA